VQKIINQKFSAEIKCEFLARSHNIFYYFFEQGSFEHIFAFALMQMCVGLKENMRVDCVFCIDYVSTMCIESRLSSMCTKSRLLR